VHASDSLRNSRATSRVQAPNATNCTLQEEEAALAEEAAEAPGALQDAASRLIAAGVRPQLAAALAAAPEGDLTGVGWLPGAALAAGHLLALPPGSAGRRLLAQTLRDIHRWLLFTCLHRKPTSMDCPREECSPATGHLPPASYCAMEEPRGCSSLLLCVAYKGKPRTTGRAGIAAGRLAAGGPLIMSFCRKGPSAMSFI